MDPDDITDGMRIRVTTDRRIVGRSWAGTEGTVWNSTAIRDTHDDYVICQVPDDGLVLIGLRPDEIEAAR